MASKTKSDLHEEAVRSGHLPESSDPDEYTVAQLENLLSVDKPAWEGSLSADEPVVAPDGHVVLSQEDIDART
jgi:hypothetical protein